MSAQSGTAVPAVSRDLGKLAPKFRTAVEAAIAACHAAGHDAMVYEAYRSNELQQVYYRRGRTVFPPPKPVTNAKTNLYSWHGYGLAVDIVSKRHYWKPPEGLAWFRAVAAIFKQHDCKWGGDWRKPDPPHMQWHACQPSPSDLARLILRTEGMAGVWAAVGAE